jgi:hypothetical protein
MHDDEKYSAIVDGYEWPSHLNALTCLRRHLYGLNYTRRLLDRDVRQSHQFVAPRTLGVQ